MVPLSLSAGRRNHPSRSRPPFTAQDFAGEDYVHAATGGGTLRFLMPPFSNNDLVFDLPTSATN